MRHKRARVEDLGDTLTEMKTRAKDKKFPFPYLYDGDDQKAF
jgi:hypothetical protein